MIVKRKSYVRSDGIRVKSTSFRVKSGKGPKIFKLKKRPITIRHAVLSSAISKGVPGLTLSHRLGALATLLKRTNPALSKKIK